MLKIGTFIWIFQNIFKPCSIYFIYRENDKTEESTTTTTTTITTTIRTTTTVIFDNPSESGTYLPKSADEDEIDGGDCGSYVGFGQIVGGEETKFGEFPFIAALGYVNRQRDTIAYRCGGVLINRFVLKIFKSARLPVLQAYKVNS